MVPSYWHTRVEANSFLETKHRIWVATSQLILSSLTHITWYQCTIKQVEHQEWQAYNTQQILYNWRQRGHTDRQTSQYYNAKVYFFTELQWSTGSTYMFQALTVLKTSCVVTLLWQISIFFSLRKESRLKFSCFA
jgi:hypothetical protein